MKTDTPETYANHFVIGESATEVILTYGIKTSGKAREVFRVILSPIVAQKMAIALSHLLPEKKDD